MKQSLCQQVGGVRSLGCIEPPYAFHAPIRVADLGDEPATPRALGDAEKAIAVARIRTLSVLRICLRAHVTQIDDSVVVANSIDVVNLLGWPRSVAKEPCKPMRSVGRSLEPDDHIPIGGYGSGTISRFDAMSLLWRTDPAELPAFGAVGQRCKNVLLIATFTRRGRHASRRRGIQNATEHGRIHGVSPRGCRACDEGVVGNASTSAGGADVLGAAPWSNPCAARPAGSPGSGCCDEAVRGEPCSGGAARAAGLMRALSSRASVTTGSDIAACCIASYKASCAPPGSWGDGRRGGVPAGAGDWLPASGAGIDGMRSAMAHLPRLGMRTFSPHTEAAATFPNHNITRHSDHHELSTSRQQTDPHSLRPLPPRFHDHAQSTPVGKTGAMPRLPRDHGGRHHALRPSHRERDCGPAQISAGPSSTPPRARRHREWTGREIASKQAASTTTARGHALQSDRMHSCFFLVEGDVFRGTVGADQLWESTSCHGGKYPIRDARWQHVRPFVNRLIADADRVGC